MGDVKAALEVLVWTLNYIMAIVAQFCLHSQKGLYQCFKAKEYLSLKSYLYCKFSCICGDLLQTIN